ncbi:hypothetical protein LOD99_4896 [Oopsacas minuta]|uniref:Spindle assembly abnormal protein 6 N-terminal domain-containing protein n=1 Tax=Oopsacas minuta TaxID=111878 RepID=A0AAV7JRY8_9METZ|nr:hypothetical protein LOD99_4896 [Oopsacas minuta]
MSEDLKFNIKNSPTNISDICTCDINTPAVKEDTNKPNSPQNSIFKVPRSHRRFSPYSSPRPDPVLLTCDSKSNIPIVQPIIGLNEQSNVFRMEIAKLFFGSLSCKPLDRLEVDIESFKLHIQFSNNDNTFEQLLHIQACNIESVEIRMLMDDGYILIKPKADITMQLSSDLNLNPTVHLNYSDPQIIKRYVTMLFETKQYPLDRIHLTFKTLFDFPIILMNNSRDSISPMPQENLYSPSKRHLCSTDMDIESINTSIRTQVLKLEEAHNIKNMRLIEEVRELKYSNQALKAKFNELQERESKIKFSNQEELKRVWSKFEKQILTLDQEFRETKTSLLDLEISYIQRSEENAELKNRSREDRREINKLETELKTLREKRKEDSDNLKKLMTLHNSLLQQGFQLCDI